MTEEREQFLDRLQLTCPADAIEAMIRGLRAAKEYPGFQVSMGFYGALDVGSDICYGRAATCTLMEAAHVRFTPYDIHPRERRARAIGVPIEELRLSEQAMDTFRRGDVCRLFEFFDHEPVLPEMTWCLQTCSWEAELPKAEAYLAQLKTRKES